MQNLMDKKQWVCRKEDKTPINPFNGYGAKANDPSTWGTAFEAFDACDQWGCVGVGVEFADGLAGVDIDSHHWEDGNPLADEILDMFDGTYIERSVSGKGWHILFYVDYDRLKAAGIINDELVLVKHQKHNKKLDIESYLKGRYFTVSNKTDNPRHPTDGIIRDMTDQFIMYLDKYMKLENPKPEVTTQIVEAVDMSIEELIDKARTGDVNGPKFAALYDDGDLSAYNNDHSAADQALCNYLAFWLGKDPVKMDEAFRHSALMRPKWDEIHKDGTITYGDMTIQNAIDGQPDVYTGKSRVNTRTGAENGSESLSEPQQGDVFDLNVLRYELAQRGISVRLNNMTHSVHFFGLPEYVDPNKAMDWLTGELYGALKAKYKYVNIKLFPQFVSALLADTRNQFNPVLDYFNGKRWDGHDYLSDLYRIMGIEDDELSKVLVKKWFMQGWALLHNNAKGDNEPYGAEGVLTLSGGQGIGKTTFFRVMAIRHEFFREGQSISSDKDTTRRAITAWITELGEIGCTFKHDMDSLKAFITDPEDTYRNHYAPTDTKELRRTNLGATVNGSQYLIDTTGNRRFWTVPLTDVDVTALRKFNATQLWLQIWEDNDMEHMTHDELGACYRLTAEQSKALNTRNGFCEKPLKFEDEVRDILAEIEDDPRHYVKRATCKQFIEAHSVLFHATAQQVSAVFDRLGVAPQLNDGKLMTVDGKRGRYREIPWV